MKKQMLLTTVVTSLLLAGCGGASAPVNPTGITLNETSVSLVEGNTKQLVATVTPDDASDKTVTWSVIEGSEFVSVSNDGLVTAIKPGNATVEAKTVNALTATCSFQVLKNEVLPTSVSLDKNEINLVIGDTVQLNATVKPDNATDKTVTWQVTSGSSYITVSNTGLVTAIAKGSSIVTVRTVNGKTATCLVNVKEEVINPTGIVLSETEIGLVDGTSKQLEATVFPDEATDKSVYWSVIEGNDVVSVSETGVVTAIKVGVATIQAKTCNDKTATCIVNVTAAVVLPTSISIPGGAAIIEMGGTAQLSATVLPENATDKTVTWSVSEGEDVVSVSETGLVSTLKVGKAIVTAKTVNDLEASVPVTVKNKSIKGYITDKKGLISGNPYEKVGDGDWVEVDNKQEMDDTIIYTFTYGASVKFKLDTVGYFVPTGLDVNGYNHSCDDNKEVTFNAIVDDPDSPLLYSLDIEVKYKDVTPKTGEYDFVVTESAHISLSFLDETKSVNINSADRGDVCFIVPEVSDENYGVKTLVGYSFLTNDTIQHKTYFDILKQADGSYKFICPFSADTSKKIFFEVTEIDMGKFKGHKLVGDYAVVRTFSLSESSMYINEFQKDTLLTFDGSGTITYKDAIAYASDANEGVLTASMGTSNFTGYYGDNILVLGAPSSSGAGASFITPLSQGSTDLIIAIKMLPGLLLENISFDNFVYVIEGNTYAVFTFYVGESLYASCFIDVGSKLVVPDISTAQYLGDKLDCQKSVFEVFYPNESTIMNVGYVNDGGKGNRTFITMRDNGYHDDDHSLVFINDDNAIYDEYTCKITSTEGNDIVLDAPTRHIEITLDPVTLTFVVTEEHEVIPKELDIANKTFTGTSGGRNPLSVVFGPSNTEITGRVIEVDGCAYFWEFTATFDSSKNELIIQVINVGYYYTYRPEVTYSYSDDGAKKGTRRIAVEDGKLTFIDNISGMTSYWITKNCVVTCDDFHF